MTVISRFRPAAGALLLAGYLMVAAGTARAEIVDAVVAVVDREPILQSDILADASMQLQELRQFTPDDETFAREADQAVQRALDAAIENRLLLREARLAGIQIDDAMVEERLNEVRAMYPSSEAFQAELQRAGETLSDLRDRLRRQLLARRMGVQKRRQFEARAVIAESDIAQFYQDNIARFSHPERLRLRQIFLSTSGPGGEQAEALAEDLYRQLREGASFEDLAAAHSQLPGAEDGGMVGWVTPGDLIEELETVAFSLAEGEHSGVVRFAGGVSILKVAAREAPGTKPLNEARADIEPELRARFADARYEEWLRQLRDAAQIRIFDYN